MDVFKPRWELKRLTKEAAEGEDPIDDDADMEAMPCTIILQTLVIKLSIESSLSNCHALSIKNTVTLCVCPRGQDRL